MGETSYKDNFKEFLFKPISGCVAALLGFDIKAEEKMPLAKHEYILECLTLQMIYSICIRIL